jgi:hypothetical protein
MRFTPTDRDPQLETAVEVTKALESRSAHASELRPLTLPSNVPSYMRRSFLGCLLEFFESELDLPKNYVGLCLRTDQ